MRSRKRFLVVCLPAIVIVMGAGFLFQFGAEADSQEKFPFQKEGFNFQEEFKSGTYVTGDFVVVAIAPNQNTVSAYSMKFGGWSRFEAPEAVRIMPVVGRDTAGLAIIAPEIKEVAAFSATRGGWYRYGLIEPAKERLDPIVSGQLVCYQVGDRIYAFSGVTGAWDVLQSKGKILFSEKKAIVQAGSRLSIFSAKTGR